MKSTFLIIGIILPIMMILFSYLSSKYSLYKRQSVRILYILTGVIFVAGGVILLPIISQPRFDYSSYRVLCGGIVAFVGIITRIVTLLYLKKQGANPNLDNPNSLVTTGPYGLVRHPQYSSGIVFLIGWFLAWGGIYSLIILPIVILAICIQAIIEEKYILINKFGDEYNRYKKNVGMLVPKFVKQDFKSINKMTQ